MGRSGFVEQFGLLSAAQIEAAAEVVKRVEKENIEVVRLSFADQHGVLRGKTLMADKLPGAMRNGCTMTSSLLAKDTSHRTVFPVWEKGGVFGMEGMTGACDFIMVPDPSTFRVLPWANKTGWMLCDIYFSDGQPIPFSTRQILRSALKRLEEKGWDYIAGLEVEFHIFKLEDAKLRPQQAGQPADPPEVSLLAHGFQYLTENRMDELDPALEILRKNLDGLDLPLRSIEVEFGPSQCEITFDPRTGLEAADNMILFRAAVKQICRRHGYHATFMCRPALPNVFSSGWHLHQSLINRDTGENVFMPRNEGGLLSVKGQQFAAGLLEHARAACVFSNPTINGYKRFKPYSLAPDRVVWGRDNKGAMIRAVGGIGDPGTRVENRVGEPAANPYLFMASQILCGLDGMERELEPPLPTETPYHAEAVRLPGSLAEALAAFREDSLFREQLGGTFSEYYLTLKEAEVARFMSEITDWEQREYFELF